MGGGGAATFGVCTHSLIVLLYGSTPSTSQPSGTSRRWAMMMVIMVLLTLVAVGPGCRNAECVLLYGSIPQSTVRYVRRLVMMLWFC